jgi:fermentation-respiration switch protein FrsA (DUF1100 family)
MTKAADPAPPPFRRSRIVSIAAGGLAIAGVLYLAAVAGVTVFQRQLMYHPDPTLVQPNVPGLPIQSVRLATADGEHLVAWYLPPRPGRPIILFFDGNGGALRWQADRWRAIAGAGVGFFAVGYRGYSGSSGRPTEAGLHEDARTAYAWVAARYPAGDIVVQGHSLGSGVAVRLAAERPIKALILEAPFTSAEDVAAGWMPVLPVRVLLWDRYRSDAWIARVHSPVMVAHGDRDHVIAFAYGQRLFALANPPKTFVRIADGDHGDLVRRGLYDHIWPFLGVTPSATTPASREPADAPPR